MTLQRRTYQMRRPPTYQVTRTSPENRPRRVTGVSRSLGWNNLILLVRTQESGKAKLIFRPTQGVIGSKEKPIVRIMLIPPTITLETAATSLQQQLSLFPLERELLRNSTKTISTAPVRTKSLTPEQMTAMAVRK